MAVMMKRWQKNYHCKDRELSVNLFREVFKRVSKLDFDFFVTYIYLFCASVIYVKIRPKNKWIFILEYTVVTSSSNDNSSKCEE